VVYENTVTKQESLRHPDEASSQQTPAASPCPNGFFLSAGGISLLPGNDAKSKRCHERKDRRHQGKTLVVRRSRQKQRGDNDPDQHPSGSLHGPSIERAFWGVKGYFASTSGRRIFVALDHILYGIVVAGEPASP